LLSADLRTVRFAVLRSLAVAKRRFIPLRVIFFFAAFVRGKARFDFAFAAGFALRPVFAAGLAGRLG
jgi:hypothetical protein